MSIESLHIGEKLFRNTKQQNMQACLCDCILYLFCKKQRRAIPHISENFKGKFPLNDAGHFRSESTQTAAISDAETAAVRNCD